MQDDLLAQYSELEREIGILEMSRETLRAEIINRLKVEGLTRLDSDYGLFTVTPRATWSYSDAVTKMEEKLKIAKHVEQEKGIAKAEVKESLRYTPK